VLALVPGLRRSAVENRRFLRRVVRFLAAEAGVSQFLDIGVGLPTQGAVHEVAREVNLDAISKALPGKPWLPSTQRAIPVAAQRNESGVTHSGQAAGPAFFFSDTAVTALAWLRAARKRCWAPCLVSP
jgi:hypothetical protein